MVLLASVCQQWVQTNHLTSIKHDIDSKHWTVTSSKGQSPFKGTLVSAGYRCSFLAIIVIQTEDKLCRYIPIWHDQVSSSEFSYLHYQLLFNTVTPDKNRTAFFSKRA